MRAIFSKANRPLGSCLNEVRCAAALSIEDTRILYMLARLAKNGKGTKRRTRRIFLLAARFLQDHWRYKVSRSNAFSKIRNSYRLQVTIPVATRANVVSKMHPKFILSVFWAASAIADIHPVTLPKGFYSGPQTGLVGSWFQSNSSRDSTNGK